MDDHDNFSIFNSARPTKNDDPVHIDDRPKQSIFNGYDPERDPNRGLFGKLRQMVEGKQAQAARLQREIEEEKEHAKQLQSDLRRLEAARQRAEDELAEFEAWQAQFVADRDSYLETHRSNWRQGKYLGLGMTEIDFIIADIPAHRAVVVEQLAVAEAAIDAFKRQHKAWTFFGETVRRLALPPPTHSALRLTPPSTPSEPR